MFIQNAYARIAPDKWPFSTSYENVLKKTFYMLTAAHKKSALTVPKRSLRTVLDRYVLGKEYTHDDAVVEGDEEEEEEKESHGSTLIDMNDSIMGNSDVFE